MDHQKSATFLTDVIFVFLPHALSFFNLPIKTVFVYSLICLSNASRYTLAGRQSGFMLSCYKGVYCRYYKFFAP